MDNLASDELEALLGTDEANLDEKGRILFGKKKRDRLGESFTIGVGPTGCLVAYPRSVWLGIVRTVLGVDPTNLGREIYTRLVLGQADDDQKFDAQGRAVIPQKLRELAKIKEKAQVVLVGCGDRLEIWAKDEYEHYLDNPEAYGQQRREAITRAMRMMKEQ